MNHLTDEQWDRLLEVLQGIREGKTIQWWDEEHEWLDDKPKIDALVLYPLRYRVKPETVTVYAYKNESGVVDVRIVDISPDFVPANWAFLYSFEHEVQA